MPEVALCPMHYYSENNINIQYLVQSTTPHINTNAAALFKLHKAEYIIKK